MPMCQSAYTGVLTHTKTIRYAEFNVLSDGELMESARIWDCKRSRMVATASTMVCASTALTSEVENAAISAGPT